MAFSENSSLFGSPHDMSDSSSEPPEHKNVITLRSGREVLFPHESHPHERGSGISEVDAEAQEQIDRREWLRQNGQTIYPEGDVCVSCLYPRRSTSIPPFVCLCLCRCSDGTHSLPHADNTQPLDISHELFSRYDVMDEEYDPQEHSDISSTSSDHSVRSLSPFEEVSFIGEEEFWIPNNYITDLVAQGRYTLHELLVRLGWPAYRAMYPPVATRDAFGRRTTFVHPLPLAYRPPGPDICPQCGLIISPHRDICNECFRPLHAHDETSVAGIGNTSTLTTLRGECQCVCDCGLEWYFSEHTQPREQGEYYPREPENHCLDDSSESAWSDPFSDFVPDIDFAPTIRRPGPPIATIFEPAGLYSSGDEADDEGDSDEGTTVLDAFSFYDYSEDEYDYDSDDTDEEEEEEEDDLSFDDHSEDEYDYDDTDDEDDDLDIDAALGLLEI